MARRTSDLYETPKGIFSRTAVSLCDQFSTRWAISSSFGIRCSTPSRVRTAVYRAPSDTIQPYVSPTAMTSFGLMDLSISSVRPLIRLEMIFCKPNPIPTPRAPPNTVRAVRSIPRLLMAMRNARVISTILVSLATSTWTDGVRLSARWMRRSSTLEIDIVTHSRMPRAITPFTTVSTETRTAPKVIAMPSRSATVASNSPRVVSAASIQAVHAMKRARASFLMTPEIRRMTTQALTRLATVRVR